MRKHRLSKHEWELVYENCKELHEVSLIQPSSFDFVAINANKKGFNWIMD
jgi:hypothetical protein